jgi:hypothetical protein
MICYLWSASRLVEYKASLNLFLDFYQEELISITRWSLATRWDSLQVLQKVWLLEHSRNIRTSTIKSTLINQILSKDGKSMMKIKSRKNKLLFKKPRINK